jgi:hypothetical protein
MIDISIICSNKKIINFEIIISDQTISFIKSLNPILTLCLIQEKVEGKIMKGGKVGGRSIFPPFGISKKVDGKKVQDGSHLKKLSSLKWMESG